MDATAKQGRTAAIFAYLTIFGTLIAYFMNNESKNPFASFHIRQGLGVHIVFYMLGMIVTWFNTWLVSAPFYVFILVLVGYGLVSAIQGEKNEVPLLGAKFQQWFRTIK